MVEHFSGFEADQAKTEFLGATVASRVSGACSSEASSGAIINSAKSIRNPISMNMPSDSTTEKIRIFFVTR
jgi:hypothetical protein